MDGVSVLSRTEDAVSADRTSGGKAHFEVLDGLRGSAAFLVVAFHLIGIPLGFNNSKNLLHHRLTFSSDHLDSLLDMHTIIKIFKRLGLPPGIGFLHLNPMARVLLGRDTTGGPTPTG